VEVGLLGRLAHAAVALVGRLAGADEEGGVKREASEMRWILRKVPTALDRQAGACCRCGIARPTVLHLMDEYLDMFSSESNRMFGHNARRARIEVARVLLGLGVTAIPNIFGDIPVDATDRQEPSVPGATRAEREAYVEVLRDAERIAASKGA